MGAIRTIDAIAIVDIATKTAAEMIATTRKGIGRKTAIDQDPDIAMATETAKIKAGIEAGTETATGVRDVVKVGTGATARGEGDKAKPRAIASPKAINNVAAIARAKGRIKGRASNADKIAPAPTIIVQTTIRGAAITRTGPVNGADQEANQARKPRVKIRGKAVIQGTGKANTKRNKINGKSLASKAANNRVIRAPETKTGGGASKAADPAE
ncbi:MAG: hypothetical protein AAGC77_11810 [Pseudomonadota bacterium]